MEPEQLSRIRKILRANPKGMTVTDISKEISLNRNSVAKYLGVLLTSGHLEMRTYGPAKVFFLSQRVPMSAMLDFSSDYILVLDRDLKIIQINDRFLQLVGIEREAALGQEIEDVSLPVFTTSGMMLNLKASLNGKEITREMAFSVGEEEFYFNVKLVPTTFDDGLPGVTIILENITERKRMEEELRQSEQRFRQLLESITDGVHVLDREWRHVVVNDAGARFVQMSKERLLGNKLTDLFPGVEKTPFFKTFKRVMETRKSDTVTSEYVFENGRKGWYEVYVYPVQEGIMAITTNVTERKKVEEELVRLSTAVKMSPDSIVITDMDAKIIDLNEATLKMYGAEDKRDLIGKNSFDLIAPEDREKALAVMNEVLEKGSKKIQEFSVVTKKGRRTVEMSLAIMKDADGIPIGFVGITRDITERKETK